MSGARTTRYGRSATGDRVRRALVAHHGELVRRHLRRFGGHEVEHTGDGFLASFAGRRGRASTP